MTILFLGCLPIMFSFCSLYLLVFVIRKAYINYFKSQLMATPKQNISSNSSGVCEIHNRQFQCFCTNCRWQIWNNSLICPTCLMFDRHKGHWVDRIEQGSDNIRKEIDEAAKEGILKFQKTENVLLDIRHTKLTLQDNKQKIQKEAEDIFDKLIATLKQRKKKVLKDIDQYYDKEIKKLQVNQNKWQQKQQVADKILKMLKEGNDLLLIQNATLIQQGQQFLLGLKSLRQPLSYHSVQMIGSLNTDLQTGKTKLSLNDLIQSLGNILKFNDININKYKS